MHSPNQTLFAFIAIPFAPSRCSEGGTVIPEKRGFGNAGECGIMVGA